VPLIGWPDLCPTKDWFPSRKKECLADPCGNRKERAGDIMCLDLARVRDFVKSYALSHTIHRAVYSATDLCREAEGENQWKQKS
jgi:hypothetical protein